MRVWPLLNRRCPDTTWGARVVRSQSLELPTSDELALKCEPSEFETSDRSGSMNAVRVCAARLKWSRWAAVELVPNQAG